MLVVWINGGAFFTFLFLLIFHIILCLRGVLSQACQHKTGGCEIVSPNATQTSDTTHGSRKNCEKLRTTALKRMCFSRTKMPAVVAATPKRLFSATFPSHPFHLFHLSHSCGAPKLLYCYTWHKILRPLMNLCRLGSLHIASMFHLHKGLKPSALTKALEEKCIFGTFFIKWKSRIKKARSPNSHGLARNKNTRKALRDSHDSRSHCMLSICRGLASKSSADKQATKTPAMSMTVDNKGPLTLAGSACHGKTWKIARCSGRIVRGYEENWHETRETVSIKMAEVMLRQFQVSTRWWSCCHVKRAARSTPKRWSTRGAEAPKITEKVTWVQFTRQQ